MSTPNPLSFAEYLCARLVIEKGFVEGAPPEAAALAAQCHHVLTWSDGLGFQLVAVIDQSRHDSRVITLGPEGLLAVGTACLPYTGSMQGTKMPVTIALWEVGVSATPERQARYEALHRAPGAEKVGISGWVIDPEGPDPAQRVWSTERWYQTSRPGMRWLRRMAAEPRASLEALAEDAAALPGDPDMTRPTLTYALLGVIAAVFAGQLAAARAWSPTVASLVSAGGLMRSLVVGEGQW